MPSCLPWRTTWATPTGDLAPDGERRSSWATSCVTLAPLVPVAPLAPVVAGWGAVVDAGLLAVFAGLVLGGVLTVDGVLCATFGGLELPLLFVNMTTRTITAAIRTI